MAIVNLLSAGVGGLLVGGAQAVSPFCEQDKRWLKYEIIFRSSLDSATKLIAPFAATDSWRQLSTLAGSVSWSAGWRSLRNREFELLTLKKAAPEVLKAREEARDMQKAGKG